MRKVVFLVSVLMMFILLAVPALAQDRSEAYIRIGHFALNVGNADVTINGELRSFGRDREFGTVSSWLLVPAGEVTIEVNAVGRSRALISATLTVEPGSRTNVLAIGDSRTMGVEPMVWTESEDELSEYYARVTIVHAHPTAGIVDLLNDGEVYLGRLAYPGQRLLADGSSNDGIVTTDILADTYDLTVVPNGQSGPVLIDLTGTALAGGTKYLVVATVDAEGNPTAVVAANTP